MKPTRLLVGIAAVVAACAFLCGCGSGPFAGPYTNLPANSGPIRPLQQCSEPEGANAYLELDVSNPNNILMMGKAWVFTKKHGWVQTDLLHIKLVLVDTHLSEVSWWADLTNVDWMGAAYQGWFGSSQVNTLMPEHSQAQPFTQQAVKPPTAKQRYALYASLPPGTVSGLGCFHPDGQHPFLSL